jgi:serine/threonine-protein kinase RsbW
LRVHQKRSHEGRSGCARPRAAAPRMMVSREEVRPAVSRSDEQSKIFVSSWPLADEKSLSAIRRQLSDALHRLDVDPDKSFDCLVAVTEACTNALVHGSTMSSNGRVAELRCEIEDDRVRFYVRDFSAAAWSIADRPPSGVIDVSAEEVERRIGGFGFPLMRHLMDEVDVHIGDRGTTVVLTKRLS